MRCSCKVQVQAAAAEALGYRIAGLLFGYDEDLEEK
jgi:hypothetical protein